MKIRDGWRAVMHGIPLDVPRKSMARLVFLFCFIGALSAQPGGTKLLVSWDDTSTGETGFEIERTYEGGDAGWKQVGTVGANVTTFLDSSADASHWCWYRIRAVDSATGRVSEWSEAPYWNPANYRPPAILNKPGSPAIQSI